MIRIDNFEIFTDRSTGVKIVTCTNSSEVIPHRRYIEIRISQNIVRKIYEGVGVNLGEDKSIRFIIGLKILCIFRINFHILDVNDEFDNKCLVYISTLKYEETKNFQEEFLWINKLDKKSLELIMRMEY